jgi:hypothetical protein
MRRPLPCIGLGLALLAAQPAAQQPQFAIDNPSCPPEGKTRDKTTGQLLKVPLASDAGLRNAAKRHNPAGSTPHLLTLDDLRALQADVNQITGEDAAHHKATFAPTRLQLQHLKVSDGTVSEGDFVRVVAVVLDAQGEESESVNCAGTDGRDIHISLGATAHASEFDGMVAEMIPQLPRPKGWDAATLLRLKGHLVHVEGGLTYDNEHMVNGDAQHPNGTQPKRMSLWEVHPITKFFVCDSGTCDPTSDTGWVTLTEWATAHPRGTT